MRGELNATTYSSWTDDRLDGRRLGSGSGTEQLGGQFRPKYAKSKSEIHKQVKTKPYEVGTASWYGEYFDGKPTASGEDYDMYDMTAAHPTLPLGSYVRVTNLRNGRAVVVKVNDRGPIVQGRIIDLSYGAARALEFQERGAAAGSPGYREGGRRIIGRYTKPSPRIDLWRNFVKAFTLVGMQATISL